MCFCDMRATHVGMAAAALLHAMMPHTSCTCPRNLFQRPQPYASANQPHGVRGRRAGDDGGTASHSSNTAAPLLDPEGSSSSSGRPASPAEALAPAAEGSTGAEAACSQGSAAPEVVSGLDGGGAAAGQEGSSGGSGDHGNDIGSGEASQDFPVAGFSRKDTPYVCQVPCPSWHDTGHARSFDIHC